METYQERERESHHKNSTVGGTQVTGSLLKVAGIHNEGNYTTIGRVSLARENEAGGSWGQKVHILHVKV